MSSPEEVAPQCECDVHHGWMDDFPERRQVAKRVDPGDGRTEVTWCLACFQHVTDQWKDHTAHLDELWRDSQGF